MKRIGWLLLAVLAVAGMTGCSSDDDVANYQGTLNGRWQGSGMAGTFTGTVDNNGSLSASAAGNAGVGTWNGSLSSANGHVSSGSGTWSAP